jgi:hypothetical protein
LESADGEYLYYGHFAVVCNTSQELLAKNQTEGQGLKIAHFLVKLFDWKTIYTFKSYKVSEHFHTQSGHNYRILKQIFKVCKAHNKLEL